MIPRVPSVFCIWRSQWRKILRCCNGFFATTQCVRSFTCARKVLRWFPCIKKFGACMASSISLLRYYFKFATINYLASLRVSVCTFLDAHFTSYVTSGLYLCSLSPSKSKSFWGQLWEDSTDVWYIWLQKISFACVLTSSGILRLQFCLKTWFLMSPQNSRRNCLSSGLNKELQLGGRFSAYSSWALDFLSWLFTSSGYFGLFFPLCPNFPFVKQRW